jgi:hypothetical protein
VQEAFAAKLDPSGNLLDHTFLGGVGNDEGNDIALDGDGNAHLAGTTTDTWGTPLRAYAGGKEIFVSKINFEMFLFLPLILR